MNKPVRILLVEDEFITGLLMGKQLQDAGYIVCKNVTTGENAIVCARKDPPDIILMDIRLAGAMDGIDAASDIKKSSDIPIIFITGYDDTDMRDRALKTNPLGYLVKPVNVSKIRKIIDDHFIS